jgi:hypothetical protein
MTKAERQKLRKAIALIANDDGANDGWHEGMKMLMNLAGFDTSNFDQWEAAPGSDATQLYARLAADQESE